MPFDRNVGTLDRWIRLAAGALVVAAAFWAGRPLWSLAGALLIATAALSRCPLYPLLGLSTCRPGPKR